MAVTWGIPPPTTAEAVKASGVKSPVIAIGAISGPEMAEDILESGKADIIGIARALIADHEFPKKARLGRADEICPCLRCLDCLTGMHTGQHFQCAVNPSAGREFRYRNYIRPATSKKKVLVVGGGPGGLKAAATAAKRGHDMTLAEKTDSLGGLLKFTDYDVLKSDLRRLKDWLITMTMKSGANVLLNTEVTPEFVKAGGYDALIVAAGSSPLIPPIPGLTNPQVMHALGMYKQVDKVGKNVALLGGGLVLHPVRFCSLPPSRRFSAQGGGLSHALCMAIDDNAAMESDGRRQTISSCRMEH